MPSARAPDYGLEPVGTAAAVPSAATSAVLVQDEMQSSKAGASLEGQGLILPLQCRGGGFDPWVGN